MNWFDVYEDDYGQLHDRQGHRLSESDEIELILAGQMLDQLTDDELMEAA